jgi:DNA repair exonuclease SbcCD ATPase subunit
MRITKVEWKNFASYGNRKQELDLSGDPALFQIVGENGAGKTSISQAIVFALYGKVEGKKLKDLSNRINGNAWTRVTLDHYGTEIVVERGLDPNLFSLKIGGKEYDKAGIRSVQDYLVDDILGIPYYVFCNTLLISANDFKSFIRMTPSDKRTIVDKIFGFHILNQMRDILKGEARSLKESIDQMTGKISSLESSLHNSLAEMEILSEEIREEHEQKSKTLTESLETFKKLDAIHEQKMGDLRQEELELSQKLKGFNGFLIQYKTQLSNIQDRLEIFQHDKCPTCESDLRGDTHQLIQEELTRESSKMEAKIEGIKKELGPLYEKEKSIRQTRIDLNEKGIKIRSKISTIENEIRGLNPERGDDQQTTAIQRIVESLKTEREKLVADKFKREEKQDWIKTLNEILGERGVKQMAIRTILPSLNSEIMALLQAMNLPYQVIFDEEFNATLYHMGMEVPAQTLSMGEMKKVDFVVLIAIMKLMKMKFSNINLLFLDEIFSSVDGEGVYAIVNILKELTREMGLNIFVINHAPMPHEIFDRKVEILKKNNFSTISVEDF